MRLRISAALAACTTLLLSACAVNEQPGFQQSPAASGELSGTLTGVGASAQDVAQQTWIAGFQTNNPGVTVNYSPEGSGTGRESFIGGGTDYAGSDRAYTVEEIADNSFAKCAPNTKPLDLPIYISPIAVVFNVDGVDALNMTPVTLAKVFAGDIAKWNDPEIVADNPGVELPDLPITAVHRADTSGTTENFTDYLFEMAGEVWTSEPSGDWPFNRGEAASQTQGVVSAISSGVGTIGYIDASQAARFATVSIGSPGNFNPPTAEAAASIVENSPIEEGRAPHDLAISLDRNADGYPIVLVSYLITCSDYASDTTAELVKAYASYVASEEGQSAAAQRAGSAPLSEGLRDQVLASIESIS